MKNILNKKSITLFLFISLIAANLQAQNFLQRLKQKIAKRKISEQKTITLSEFSKSGIGFTENISYGPDKYHKMDLFYSKILNYPKKSNYTEALKKDVKDNNSPTLPLILMIHGGAWRIGDKSNSSVIKNKVLNWVPKGFIFASINYRLYENTNPDEQMDDIIRCIKYLHLNYKGLNIDKKKIILMGHSAGAHLAALCACSNNIFLKNNIPMVKGTIVLDSAVLNVKNLMSAWHAKFYDPVFKKDINLWNRSCPTYALSLAENSKACNPILIVASKKRPRALSASKLFHDTCINLGIKVELITLDLTHGEINLQLGLPSEYTEKVDNFIIKILNKK